MSGRQLLAVSFQSLVGRVRVILARDQQIQPIFGGLQIRVQWHFDLLKWLVGLSFFVGLAAEWVYAGMPQVVGTGCTWACHRLLELDGCFAH